MMENGSRGTLTCNSAFRTSGEDIRRPETLKRSRSHWITVDGDGSVGGASRNESFL